MGVRTRWMPAPVSTGMMAMPEKIWTGMASLRRKRGCLLQRPAHCAERRAPLPAGKALLRAWADHSGRLLLVAFTIRRSLIRVISIRDSSSAKARFMPGTKKKPVPEFRSEDEESGFWAKQDSTKYVDWDSARRRKVPGLRPPCGQFQCGCPSR
jgi:hypothetical protein